MYTLQLNGEAAWRWREVYWPPRKVFDQLQTSILPLGYRLNESSCDRVGRTVGENVRRFRRRIEAITNGKKRKKNMMLNDATKVCRRIEIHQWLTIGFDKWLILINGLAFKLWKRFAHDGKLKSPKYPKTLWKWENSFQSFSLVASQFLGLSTLARTTVNINPQSSQTLARAKWVREVKTEMRYTGRVKGRHFFFVARSQHVKCPWMKSN